MNLKNLASAVIAVSLFGSVAFGQTIQVTGTVTTLTDTQISLLCGPDTWNIKKDATTNVTSGTLSVGNMVTVQCLSADAQKIPGNAQKKE
jgi:hypothetical protein